MLYAQQSNLVPSQCKHKVALVKKLSTAHFYFSHQPQRPGQIEQHGFKERKFNHKALQKNFINSDMRSYTSIAPARKRKCPT